MQNDHVQQGNTVGERRISWGQSCLPSRGWSPCSPQFLGFSSIDSPGRRTTKFGVVTRAHVKVRVSGDKCVVRFVSELMISCYSKVHYLNKVVAQNAPYTVPVSSHGALEMTATRALNVFYVMDKPLFQFINAVGVCLVNTFPAK